MKAACVSTLPGLLTVVRKYGLAMENTAVARARNIQIWTHSDQPAAAPWVREASAVMPAPTRAWRRGRTRHKRRRWHRDVTPPSSDLGNNASHITNAGQKKENDST